MKRLLIPSVLTLSLAACVAPRHPAPAPAPTPAPAPRPTPTPAPVASDRYSGDWSVDPLTPAGDWSYARGGAGGSAANFADARGNRSLVIACSGGQLTLTRAGSPRGGSELRVRTSFGERRLPVDGSGQALTTRLPATDPLWEQIAFSRGRFVVEATGQAPMIVPARPEIGRVIEDCRG